MGLFDKKTEAEKRKKELEKQQKKEAREEKREARKDEREDRKEERQEEKEVRQTARAEKKDARQDARDAKQDARQDARAEKKDAREEKRADMKEIRQSDLKGKEKREEKKEVRDEKRDAIDAAVGSRKAGIDKAKDDKDEAIDEIERKKLEAMAAVQVRHDEGLFDATLALELLALCGTAENLTAAEILASTNLGTLNGHVVQSATPIFRENFKSDTECFVGRSDEFPDIVVAFRGSETRFFNKSGAFKDWALTDLRSNAIPYPPAPQSWPDRRYVHNGFWDAYNLVRNPLLAEVGKQTANLDPPAKRIYVTGFSLGGALALLAALDIADAVKTPVELFTFAAPRVGDASLNKLLEKRLHKSTLITYRGDPVVHLPPLGPNFPVTFRHPVSFNPGGIHIPLGNPVPQINQQYRTADRHFHINADGEVHERFPTAQIALRFNDHNFGVYQTALTNIKNAQTGSTASSATSTRSAASR